MKKAIPPAFTEEFQKDEGYRFRKGRASLLLMEASVGHRLKNEEIFAFSRAISNFLLQVRHGGEAAPEKPAPDGYRPMTIGDFPDRSAGPFYKYLPRDAWENFVSKGKFRLGTPRHYRATENENIRDRLEGVSMLVLTWKGDEYQACVEVGNNFAVYCGSREMNPDDDIKHERFGEVCIEILDVPEFARRVAKTIGATSYAVHDVVYCDAKAMSAEADFSRVAFNLRAYNGRALDEEALHLMNVELFEIFHGVGRFASLFSKPVDPFYVEAERRIAFEMPRDLGSPTLTFTDRGLLELIQQV